MSTKRTTDETLALFENIDSYYIGTADDNDEFLVDTTLEIHAVRVDGMWKYVGSFKVDGPGGLDMEFKTEPHDTPDDAVTEMDGWVDEQGFICSNVTLPPRFSETTVRFKLGPDVDNFTDWPG